VDNPDDAPDAPDLSLRLVDTLVSPETEIKSVTQDAIYDSAHKFEDLPLSPELLKVGGLGVGREWGGCGGLPRSAEAAAAVPPCRRVVAPVSESHRRSLPQPPNPPPPRPTPQGLYSEMKFDHPSRIQATTLPMILQPDQSGVYRDLIAQAHNGSGKTTCFVLAMLSRCVGARRGGEGRGGEGRGGGWRRRAAVGGGVGRASQQLAPR
jgi:hypothetical protein